MKKRLIGAFIQRMYQNFHCRSEKSPKEMVAQWDHLIEDILEEIEQDIDPHLEESEKRKISEMLKEIGHIKEI